MKFLILNMHLLRQSKRAARKLIVSYRVVIELKFAEV
jgi:hypothetical protein